MKLLLFILLLTYGSVPALEGELFLLKLHILRMVSSTLVRAEIEFSKCSEINYIEMITNVIKKRKRRERKKEKFFQGQKILHA